MDPRLSLLDLYCQRCRQQHLVGTFEAWMVPPGPSVVFVEYPVAWLDLMTPQLTIQWDWEGSFDSKGDKTKVFRHSRTITYTALWESICSSSAPPGVLHPVLEGQVNPFFFFIWPLKQ